MKKVVIASDSLKGTLSSKDIIDITKEVIKENKLDIELVPFIIADGGEGTVDAFSNALKGELKTISVKDANGFDIEATYFLYNKKAVIEVASAISLPNTKIQNPLITSSYGVGQLIKSAIDNGAKEIIVGLGGSATNDGGVGMLSALGVKFFDKDDNLIQVLSNQDLINIHHFDKTQLDELIKDVHITGMCDVENPLLGPNGATYIYSPQKGATDEMLPILEKNMEHYKNIVYNNINEDYSLVPGAGAAGGLGFALVALLHAKLESGINLLLDNIGFDEAIKDADLVISGEGRLDKQSFYGKVIDGVSSRCMKNNTPLTLIVGCVKDNFDQKEVIDRNIKDVLITSNGETEFEEIKKNARSNYKRTIEKYLKK